MSLQPFTSAQYPVIPSIGELIKEYSAGPLIHLDMVQDTYNIYINAKTNFVARRELMCRIAHALQIDEKSFNASKKDTKTGFSSKKITLYYGTTILGTLKFDGDVSMNHYGVNFYEPEEYPGQNLPKSVFVDCKFWTVRGKHGCKHDGEKIDLQKEEIQNGKARNHMYSAVIRIYR